MVEGVIEIHQQRFYLMMPMGKSRNKDTTTTTTTTTTVDHPHVDCFFVACPRLAPRGRKLLQMGVMLKYRQEIRTVGTAV
jgi:hypothetical protein